MLPAVQNPNPLPIDISGAGAAPGAAAADSGTAGFAQALQRAKTEPAAPRDMSTREVDAAAKADSQGTEPRAPMAQGNATAPADAADAREPAPKPAVRDPHGDDAGARPRTHRPTHGGARATTRAALAPDTTATPRADQTSARAAIAAALNGDRHAAHEAGGDDRAAHDPGAEAGATTRVEAGATTRGETAREHPPGVDAIDPATIAVAQPAPTSPNPPTSPAPPPIALPATPAIAPPATPSAHRLAASVPKTADAAAAGSIEPAATPPARGAVARVAHDTRTALRGEAPPRAGGGDARPALTAASTDALQRVATGERSTGERFEQVAGRSTTGDAATPFASRLHERLGGDAAITVSAGAAGRSEAAPTAAASSAERPTMHATLHSAIDDAGFGPALGTQVAVWVRDGVQEAQLRLHPAELGPVTVQIALDGNAAQVDFTAAAAATRTSIEQSLPALAAALRESGFTLTGGGVHDRTGGGDAGSQPRRDGGDGRGRSRVGAIDGGGLDAAGGRAALQRVGRSLVDLYA